MRLTLRTLLAYLDERLEPADAADIGHRIEESSVAMQVVNRVRDVTRRLRLGAPRLTGKQLGLDPNLVAEYLDNTLPAERIPEFEKVCLGVGGEADAHLAEVASCHQVLALVLSSPATVDPACRQRMYRLGATPASASPLPLAQAELAESRTLVVPDYLRPTASRWPWIAIPIAAVVLGFLAFAISKSLSPRGTGPLAQANRPSAAPATAESPDVGDDPLPADEDAPGAPLPDPGNSSDEPPAPTLAEPEAASGTPEASPTATEATSDTPLDATTAPAISPEITAPAGPSSEEMVDESPLVEEPLVDEPMTDEPGLTAEPADSPSGDALPLEPGAESVSTPPAPMPALPVASDAPHATPGETAPPADDAIGRMVSEEGELIAVWSEPERAWIRVPAKQPLRIGDRLLSFPSFRPKFTLSSGVTIELVGAARVELVGPDAEGAPGLKVEFGRVMALTSGKTGVQLRFLTADDESVATFASPDSVLGFEVRPTHIEGLDPAEEPPHFVSWIYASQGTIDWENHGEQTELAAPHVAQIEGGQLTTLDEALPPWVLGQDRTSALDIRARNVFATQMALERPVDLSLKELGADRRIEVRSLSMRCMALLDEFEGLLAALGQTEMRSGWNNYIESLRFAMAAQPDAAQRVREALQRERGADAQRLYRLLWGFNRDQLAQGEADDLVTDLENESLDLRVLANWNVARITGKSFYQPEQTAKRRQSAVQRLRRMVDEGQFLPASGLPGEAPLRSEGESENAP